MSQPFVESYTGKRGHRSGKLNFILLFSRVEYFKNPKATSETIDKDGWLHTGDLVMIDNDGYIHVLDRLKELIKYNAYQVT